MRPTHRRIVLVSALLVLGLAAPARLQAARILVGSVDQKVSGIGPCSLQEAIYSSEFQASLAIDATDPDDFVPTNCVAGTGTDTIVLPPAAVFQLSTFLDGDAYNPYGPTATPIIFSNITIEGNGAILTWTGTGNVRLFAVGPASIDTPNGTRSGTGHLTLQHVYIKGFHVKGGDGPDGGGGGMGAGGAVYLQNGALTVDNCTFDGNGAEGGSAIVVSGDLGGGGGGLGGNGGALHYGGGSGGGGARGNGGVSSGNDAVGGGGGGGTVFNGGSTTTTIGGSSGYLCGGNGGDDGNDGRDGKCPGGGGGGGGKGGDGGNGAYGGGGGGGCDETSSRTSGGNGGFGGGGGGSCNGGAGGSGGNGGFGGGGGVGDSFDGLYGSPGKGGYGGGDATPDAAGGGGALGGAIFNDSGILTVRNSTFTNNFVDRGTGAHNGGDAGGAIFSRNGTTTVIDSTIAGNQSTGSGGGIVVHEDGSSTSLTLDDTIVANNGANECLLEGSITSSGAGNLIVNNGTGACPGVVATGDPQLGSLQRNGGNTPTMEISASGAAAGTADPATSLGTDQRGTARPQFGHWDIGAYEICRNKLGPAPCILPILNFFAVPTGLAVDQGGSVSSNNDGVLQPGETVPVAATWANFSDAPVSLTATASGLSGNVAATYTIPADTANYGTIAVGSSGQSATPYRMSVSVPANRPTAHWDASFTELPSTGDPAKIWKLHVGDSFTDVPRSQPFYKKIETLLHNGITSGCTALQYCPAAAVPRGSMAVFIARGLADGETIPVSGTVNGSPYNCSPGGTSLFTDVAPTDTICKAVHYIAKRNVTTGCSPGLFCPAPDVMRSDMSIFIARAVVAPNGGAAIPLTYRDGGTGLSYSCDPSSPNLHFTDVHVTDTFCKHVHYLWARGMVTGCTATTYCPTLDVTRDVMSKFLVNAFRLVLYRP
jgi:hypothetical protein